MNIVTAAFSVSTDAFVLGEILRDGEDTRITLTQFVPIEGALIPYFWAETANPDAFETKIRTDERVANLTKLDNGSSKALYQIDWATEIDGLLAALQDHDLIVEEATGTAESWRFRVRGPDHENLSSFQRACHDHDVPIEIHWVRHPNDGGWGGIDHHGMTDKQYEAVQAAFTNGYFSVPRETTLGELGEQFGITRQSFSRRLARGLGRLLEDLEMDSSG